jgi:2'-5' RNA ligase
VRLFVAIETGAPGSPAPDHLTLAFLGEVPEERGASIADALVPVAAAARPFELTLEGVGAFPDPDRPRVVWVGARQGRDEVERLAAATRDALGALGFSFAREPFVAHVTLLRVRGADDRRRARELLEGRVAPPPARTLTVREILVKESERTAAGVRHSTRAALPLGT